MLFLEWPDRTCKVKVNLKTILIRAKQNGKHFRKQDPRNENVKGSQKKQEKVREMRWRVSGESNSIFARAKKCLRVDMKR